MRDAGKRKGRRDRTRRGRRGLTETQGTQGPHRNAGDAGAAKPHTTCKGRRDRQTPQKRNDTQGTQGPPNPTETPRHAATRDARKMHRQTDPIHRTRKTPQMHISPPHDVRPHGNMRNKLAKYARKVDLATAQSIHSSSSTCNAASSATSSSSSHSSR